MVTYLTFVDKNKKILGQPLTGCPILKKTMTYRKEFYIMNKICLIILCTCHTTPQLEGTWICEKSPLEIDKDLSFNIYDAEAGNL